jgi:hypothetical protein
VTRLLAAGAVAVAVLAPTAAATPEQVTIDARPSVAGWGQPVALSGSVDTRRAEEVVTIQAKDCRQQFFRDVDWARTHEGGGWSTDYYPGISTTLRAQWNGRASAEITVRQRPSVQLRRLSARRFAVRAWGFGGAHIFWRKRVLFQRFDRRLGSWETVKNVVLTESSGPTSFSASVPRGALVRTLLPRSQARPCYLAGYSGLFRT